MSLSLMNPIYCLVSWLLFALPYLPKTSRTWILKPSSLSHISDRLSQTSTFNLLYKPLNYIYVMNIFSNPLCSRPELND